MTGRRRISSTQIHAIELNAVKLSVPCQKCWSPAFKWCKSVQTGKFTQQLHTGRRPV